MKKDKTLMLWLLRISLNQTNNHKMQVCVHECVCVGAPILCFLSYSHLNVNDNVWLCMSDSFGADLNLLGFVSIFVTLWLSHFILALFVTTSLRHHSPVPSVSGKCSLNLVSVNPLSSSLSSLFSMLGSGPLYSSSLL